MVQCLVDFERKNLGFMGKKNVYVAPCVKAVAFRVEQGFAGSGNEATPPPEPQLQQFSVDNTIDANNDWRTN